MINRTIEDLIAAGGLDAVARQARRDRDQYAADCLRAAGHGAGAACRAAVTSLRDLIATSMPRGVAAWLPSNRREAVR